jgi:prepilin-type N-terminal cleavage/methylation domain-containing protein
MKRASPDRFASLRGFTLIESVIVLVVLSVAAAVIIKMQGAIFYGQSQNQNLEVGARLMLACAEHILTTRQRQSGGFAITPACDSSTFPPANYGDFAPTVGISSVDSNTPGCPGTCNLVTISASKSGVTAGMTPVITLMLVSY